MRDTYEYYKAEGRWDRALDIMRDAARMKPSVFDPLLEEALDDLLQAGGMEQEHIRLS